MPVATDTPNYLVGKFVAVKADDAYAFVESGNVDRQVASVECTNSRSGGFREKRAGIKDATGSCSCFYNGDSPPVGIVEGAYVDLIIDSAGYAKTGDTPKGRYIAVYALITKVTDTWNVGADYKWSFNWESSGEYVVTEDHAAGGALTSGT